MYMTKVLILKIVMKKVFLLFAIVSLIANACVGSDVLEENNGGTPFSPKITISLASLEFDSNGGEQNIDITTNFEYKVSESADWLNVEVIDSGINVVADRNENTQERSATITISSDQYDVSKAVNVRQAAYVPKIELSNQSIEVEFEPNTYTVSVTSPYSWKAESDNEWIDIESKTGIAGTEELSFKVERNEEEKERKGTILLTNSTYNLAAELYVTQKIFKPEISIEPETLNFAFEGGIQEVVITSNFEYEVSVSAEWVTFAKIDNGIAVSVHDYTEIDERSAEITISSEKYNISKTVKVLQGAFEPEISIEPETLNFAFEGGVQEVVITTNFEYTVSENVDWLSYVKTGNGIKITTSTNVKEKERTADVIIYNNTYGKSTTIKVIQQKFVPTFTINTTHLIFEAIGGTQNLNITTNFDYQIVTNADWLSYKKTSSGVVLTATANIDKKERSANITIIAENYDLSRTVNVSQNALSEAEYAKYSIFYTSTDGNIVTPFYTNVFGANIVSNTYENGKGIIKFDAPVTEIGTHAFIRCSSLTSVTIPDSVTEIGSYAFSDCSSLTSVTIPDSVTEIGHKAFYECKGELVINSKTLVEKDYPTSECPTNSNSGWLYGNLFTKLTIDDNITKIGLRSFRGCSSLRSITIPNSVTTIENEAFRGCSSLTSVTIPESVTRIGGSAFYGCWNLRRITIPNSVTKIGGSAFYECSGELVINSKTLVEKDYTTSDYPTINSNSGWLYGNLFTKLTIGDNVTKIGNYTFCRCSSLGSVTIGNGVTEIGSYAFYGCSSLTSVTIGNSVTKIGMDAFYNCSSLKSVHISDLSAWCKISFFANPLFYAENLYLNGNLITELTIPSDITEIRSKAFLGCSSLTSVTIPDSVTTIGGEAFRNCRGLTSVYCRRATPPTGGSSMFDNNASGRNIYVPRNSVSAYMSASYWSSYASYIVGYDF